MDEIFAGVDEMPVSKNRTVLEVVRGVGAFLNPESKVAREETSEPGARTAAPETPGVPERTSAYARKLEQAWRRTAEKGRVLAKGVRGRLSGGGKAGGIEAENIVWIFGSGRTGSTWLSSMMREMRGQTVWREPLVGALFGELYYVRAGDRIGRRAKHFILGGGHKETWLGHIRDFVLGGAAARFPRLASRGGYLVIKEPNGSVGAPLLMEALPESRMVLLVRDPRDATASWLDARRRGGWRDERKKKQGRDLGPLVDKDPDTFVEHFAEGYLRNVGSAKEAYDAHEGRKALVRYEDLRADTLGTMRGMYAALGIPVDEEELARAVEKHAWERIPEEEKGRGKFYRKAAPGAWRGDLSPEQVEIVEDMTAPLLREFYPGEER